MLCPAHTGMTRSPAGMSSAVKAMSSAATASRIVLC
jgi:hypothetical protein